jgi:hypothetical protein
MILSHLRGKFLIILDSGLRRNDVVFLTDNLVLVYKRRQIGDVADMQL